MSPFGTVQELQNIIEKRELRPLFQPIADTVLGGILGYEALIRGPADSALHSPLMLFEAAQRHDLLAELEFACREVSCRAFAGLRLAGKLFLNISPMALLASNHRSGVTRRMLAGVGLPAERVVIEVSEHYPLDDYKLIREATHYYRKMGFEIAIDDLGSGYSGLKVWSELRPEYVKIDRHFIENLHRDTVKREFVRSIQDIGRGLGCRIIAEGVETREEYAALCSLGIEFQQGFFLARPASIPPAVLPLQRLVANVEPSGVRARIAELLTSADSVEPQTSVDQVNEMFRRNRNLTCVPVCEGGKALGVVSRLDIQQQLSSRYGRELYGRKPVHQFISAHSLLVDINTPISQVSRLITDNCDYDLNLDFIITDNDQYLGLARPRALLRRITEQQLRSARYSNPLTQLPGNVPLHETIDELLQRNVDFHVAYCDLNHFKPYNDHFGYSRGDEVILMLSEVLQAQINGEQDQLFHVGGDDLVLVLQSDDWESRCAQSLKNFALEVHRFYPENAILEGGIWGENRRGEEKFFPLLSLAIGVVNPDSERCHSHHDIAALLADAKHQAKRLGGNQVFVSRRRGPYARSSLRSLQDKPDDSTRV